MARVAICLTTYNRPKLVADAIRSVFGQTTDDWRLYIMDDGSSLECRMAITEVLKEHLGEDGRLILDTPHTSRMEWPNVTWWLGPDRTAEERKRTISYSRSINFALNFLLQEEKYVTYLCDDDSLYAESIKARADYLDAHPCAHVVFGRLRAVQFQPDGTYNKWSDAGAPRAGMHFPRPTGRIEYIHNGQASKVYFADPNERDPETGLPYVECGFWHEGPYQYGNAGRIDHNQCLHRRECLTDCAEKWKASIEQAIAATKDRRLFDELKLAEATVPYLFPPNSADLGGTEFWGEDMKWGVGDYAFFSRLSTLHSFHGIDAWVASKRYHSFSDGVQTGVQRE